MVLASNYRDVAIRSTYYASKPIEEIDRNSLEQVEIRR